jgi:hypothetical protein
MNRQHVYEVRAFRSHGGWAVSPVYDDEGKRIEDFLVQAETEMEAEQKAWVYLEKRRPGVRNEFRFSYVVLSITRRTND